MMYGAKQILRYLLGTDIAGRKLAVRADDTFLVSYPRSGNTWTRFLVANLLFPAQPVSFANIEQLIPDAEAQSSRRMKRVPSPRIIKSHQYFDHRYPKVVYIVRDPRDVVLSYYDFARKSRHIPDEYPLQNFVSQFVSGELSMDWGTWGENVGSWVGARLGQRNFLLLRYEDLLARPEEELAKVARFLGVQPAPERLLDAVQRSSAERMRDMEKSQKQDWVTIKGKRPDIPFIGTAISRKWESKLPAEAVLQIESAWGPLMNQLQYTLKNSSQAGQRRDIQLAEASL